MTQDNPIVVITGATAGVGRAAANEFARHGYKIALVARDAAGLEETRHELESLGATTITVQADTANADEIEQAAENAERELGPIDVWINAAASTVFSAVDTTTPEEYREVTHTVYLGYIHGTLAALKRMKPRDAGTIVQVGSAMAYRSIPLQSAYCGAKAAIRAFTDSLHSELIHDKSRVRLTMVQLPAHNTPQFDWARNKLDKSPRPVSPVYQPEVAGRAIYRAARKAPRELWVGRSSIMAIAGNTLAPKILDRIMARLGYRKQMDEQPAVEERPGNLEHPVSGLHQEHGRFDHKAKSHAISMKQETVSGATLAAAGAGFVAAAAGLAYLVRAGVKRTGSRRKPAARVISSIH